VREVMETLEREVSSAAEAVRHSVGQLEQHLDRTSATIRKGIDSLPPPGTVAVESSGRRRRRG
jgi:hypothetical protein